jgi:hypothetical protein
MGENLCQLDNQTVSELQTLNSPKINDPMKTWANELNRSFLMEEVQRAKKHIKTNAHHTCP